MFFGITTPRRISHVQDSSLARIGAYTDNRSIHWVVILLILASSALGDFVQGARPAAEFWIALRSDGKPGSGTMLDPFNGGTQPKLDALMARLPAHSRIQFGRGIFLTNGIQAKDGWRISGRGKDRTTIKLSDGALVASTPGHERCVIFQFDFQGFLRSFELRDLTIDCNRANQPAFRRNLRGYSLDAWVIAARSAKMSNVRAVGTWVNPGEGFPCRVYHDGSKNRHDRVEISDCDNLHPIGYLTAISVFDQQGGTVSGFIRHCVVTDHAGGAAFGAGGWRNFEVSHNSTRNVATPIVIDTHDYYNVRIFDNHFYNIGAYGVLFNGSGVYDHIKIYDNLFQMAPLAAGPCLLSGNAKVTAKIYRNRIYQRNLLIPILSQGSHTSALLRDNIVRQSRRKP